MSAGARRIEKRVPDGLAGALKRTCSAIFSRGADAVIGGPEWAIRACGNLSWRDWQCPRGIGGCDCSCMSAPARVFLKFSRIAPGLQSDAETDGLHVARLFSTRTTRKREAMARGGVAFHASFPNLADCAYRNSRLTRGVGRARGVATYRARRQPRPRNIRPKRRARFICAAPKVSCAAGSGVCGLRVKKTPANSQ